MKSECTKKTTDKYAEWGKYDKYGTDFYSEVAFSWLQAARAVIAALFAIANELAIMNRRRETTDSEED